MIALFWALCIGLAVAGSVAALFEIAAVRAFHRSRDLAPPTGAGLGAETSSSADIGLDATSDNSSHVRGVTIVKPLHGAEPGLDDNLMSFAVQSYTGPAQILFGVAEAGDDAVAAVRLLQAALPHRDIELVVTGTSPCGNAKVANLAGMTSAIRHELIVISDSDIRVPSNYLAQTLALMEQPGVGLVTWLYSGEADRGLWARLSAMAIDYHFFPSVLLGLRVGRAQPCVGATMALTRQTLDAIGGFAAFAAHLADDHAIGQAVRRTGLSVVLAPNLVTHRCLERSAEQLFQHELRWARTIRAIDPAGFAGSVVMHPLPFALVATLLPGKASFGIATLAATLICRGTLQWQVDRSFGRSRGHSLAGMVLGPVRDILSFCVFCLSYVVNAVVWRGKRYLIRPDGTMAESKESNP